MEFKHPSFPVKPGRTSVKISVEDIKKKYIEAILKHKDLDDYCKSELSELEPNEWPTPYFIKWLTPEIEKDLSKVDFDTENVFVNDDCDEKPQVLPNGVTVIPCLAGGDWEIPIGFVIYWDGKKLRAYIPPNGNLYNRITKKAYGNDDENDDKLDSKDMMKWYGTTEIDTYYTDFNLMLQDVQIRINLKN